MGEGCVAADRDGVDSLRHCEERSDEAIHVSACGAMDCFAEPVIGPALEGRTRWLAMTRLAQLLIAHVLRALGGDDGGVLRGTLGRALAARNRQRLAAG